MMMMMMMGQKQVWWRFVAAAVFFALGVGGALDECNRLGTSIFSADGGCDCLSGSTGPDCSERRCPAGRSWVDYPTAVDEAHAEDIECSGMGYCDRVSGQCACRAGFDGSACQRMACPADDLGVPCSGRGRCVTKRMAADGWDGLRLVRPNVSYDLWDADGILGCLCDAGYSGYNCSQVECPRGDIASTDQQQNERVHIECQADAGSFAVTFRGHTTRQIPYDCPYAHLQKALEDLPSVRAVQVTYATNRTKKVCEADFKAVTDIEFTQDFGDLPALRVAAEDLTLHGDTPHLVMLTRQQLVCPSDCYAGCTGGFYLGYDGALTSKLSWNASALQLQQALAALPTLNADSDFGDVNVTVNGSASICDGDWGNKNTTIEFRAAYGNVYNLTLVNSLRSTANGDLANLTLVADKGTKENDLCSDRGWCDLSSGTCLCNQFSRGPFEYAFASSDGYGNPGARGDCGRAVVTPRSCPAAYIPDLDRWVECSGVGKCNNATFLCTCNAGYYSANCALRACPRGVAWFSEASAKDEAFQVTECSGMGDCERSEGRCICRAGFGGPACERLDCPYASDATGAVCSGHGTCQPMWRLAELADGGIISDAGLTYGTATQNLAHVWDSRSIYGCHCDTRNSIQPYNGPVEVISGVAVHNPMVGGYTGYDCSRRWCPTGDNPRTTGQAFEVQTIYFTGTAGDYYVDFRHGRSPWLHVNSNASYVEWALENMTTVGDVDVLLLGDAVRVTFKSELGDLPMMRASHGFTVNETVKGTKENVECSNKGYCDYATGECQCLRGYVGGDGDGGIGNRRDCSRRDPSGQATLNEYGGPVELT